MLDRLLSSIERTFCYKLYVIASLNKDIFHKKVSAGFFLTVESGSILKLRFCQIRIDF